MDEHEFGRRGWRGGVYSWERTDEPRQQGESDWEDSNEPTWRGTAYGEERAWRGREYNLGRRSEFGYSRPYGRSFATFEEDWRIPGP